MSTTIGKVAFVATWDATQLTRGVMTSRQMFSAQKKIIEQSQTPLERYTNGMENLRMLVARYPAVLKHQVRIQGDLQREYLESEAAVRKLTATEVKRLNHLRGLAEAEAKRADAVQKGRPDASAGAAGGLLSRGGGMVAAATGVGVYSLATMVKDSIRLSAEVEKSAAAFEVFLGSSEKARQVMADLRNLSMESGASFDSLQNSAKTMLSFGVATDKVLPSLRSFAAIAQGDQVRMQSLSLAFAQASNMGRLTGEDRNQMAGAGFNPFEEMSKKTGKSFAQLRDEMEKGRITFEMVADSLAAATGEGGRYNGMLEKMADTTAGSLNRLEAAWEVFKTDVGDMLQPLTEEAAMLAVLMARTGSEAKNLGKIGLPTTGMFSRVGDAWSAINEEDPAKQIERISKLMDEVSGSRQVFSFIMPEQVATLDAAMEKLREHRKLTEEAAQAQAELDKKNADRMAAAEQRTAAGNAALSAEIARLENELNVAHFGKAQAKLMEFQNQGANNDLLEDYQLLTKRLEVIAEETRQREEQKKAAEKMQRDQERMQQKMKDDAESITRQFDPIAELADKLDSLQGLRSAGLIDGKTFNAAKEESLRSSVQQEQSGPQGVGMQANSMEAYKYIVDLQRAEVNKGFQESQKQTNLLKALKVIQERASQAAQKSEEHLAEIADIDFGTDG